MPRIVLRVAFEGELTVAVLDTGAPYVVCAPELAHRVGITSHPSLSKMRLQVRGFSVEGQLYRLAVTFPADLGHSLTIDATAFVPDMEWIEVWGDLPSFIGLNGCLERMRFAVDPISDSFYFGPLE